MDDEKYQARKARSMEMLNNGLEPVKDGFNEYWIPSQTDKGKKYKVTIKDGWYSCECPDNQKGNLCKHILLLKTYLALKFKEREVKQTDTIGNLCPCCKSVNLKKDGTRKTTLGKKQRWLCLGCGKRFVLDPVKKIKGNLDAVTMAMDLYMKGVSYRGVKDSLEQFLGLRVSHVTIMNWIQTYMEKINDYLKQYTPQVSETWQADEQLVNVKGRYEYLWNCMDKETRFLLANQVTPSRTYVDARNLFKQAKETADMKAKKITTDGAFAYEGAVTKEFWTHSNPHPHERYVSIRQQSGNNNRLERYHGSFRQRDKVMRGFKTEEKTQEYAQNFKTYYNFVREHQGLKTTPAKVAGINESRNWKELLVKSLSAETS